MAKKQPPPQAAFTELWPEWFSLGYGIKGWTVDFEVAEAWRVASGFSEEFCLDKVYVIRGWWDKDKEKKGKDPYANFQRACRENWGSRNSGRPARSVPSTNPEDFKVF